jgi:hypothetical protein
MAMMIQRGKESTQARCKREMESKAFALLRDKRMVETTPEDLKAVLKRGGAATNHYLRRLYNLALDKQGATRSGATYGNPLLVPLIGGSGGGGSSGQPGGGGGGGGGAIMIASNTRILVSGTIEAKGGRESTFFNGGSGGAIRLVSMKVEGTGTLDVRPTSQGGSGRIRVDTIDVSNLRLVFHNADVTSVGGNLFTFPPVLPRLETIEVAGNLVAAGSGPVLFNLPFGSTPDRTVKIQASNFGRVVPISVILTPNSGPRQVIDAEIDNTTSNPAVVEVPVTFPVNTLVTVHAWTR